MCLSQIFKKACEKYYVGKECLRADPCHDEFVAIIDLSINDFRINNIVTNKIDGNFLPRSNYIRNAIKNYSLPVIIFVLESPHIDEYDISNKVIGPAMGVTGRNIKDNIIKKLGKLTLKNQQYRLILVEAVSYQCSMGEKIDTERRDMVFKEVWDQGGREDFINRIKKYNPEIIINGCTGGKNKIDSKNTLNSIVQDALDENFEDIDKYYCSHPCSYWFIFSNLIKR